MPAFLGLTVGSDGKESTCNAGDLGSIPGLGRSLGKDDGYPLQQNREAWQDPVYEAAKSQARLSDFHFLSHKLSNFFSLF